MKRLVLPLMAITALLLSTTACDKDDDDNTPAPETKLLVANASPNSPSLDITANGAPVSSNLAYPDATTYGRGTPGTYNIKVAPTGTTSYTIDTSFALDASKNYSIFIVDT